MIVPCPPMSIGITITFMFHTNSNSLAMSLYFFLFFDFFYVNSEVHQNSKVQYLAISLLVCWLSLILVVSGRLGDLFVSQNPWEECASHSPRRIPCWAYTNCSYDQISAFCTVPSGSPFLHNRVKTYALFTLIWNDRLLSDWSFCVYHRKTYICYFIASDQFLI